MDWPYRFPHSADVIAEEAEKIKNLSDAERLDRVFELIATGQLFSGDDAAQIAYRRAEDQLEADWQRAHREVFERYGR